MVGPAAITHITNLDHDLLIDLPAPLVVELVELSFHFFDGLFLKLLGCVDLLFFRIPLTLLLTGSNVNVDFANLLIVNIRWSLLAALEIDRGLHL